MSQKYNDHPIEQCARTIREKFASGDWPEDTVFYQKWTCEKCGERVVGNNANQLHTHGHHEECGHVTDLRLRGCNYMVYFRELPRVL